MSADFNFKGMLEILPISSSNIKMIQNQLEGLSGSSINVQIKAPSKKTVENLTKTRTELQELSKVATTVVPAFGQIQNAMQTLNSSVWDTSKGIKDLRANLSKQIGLKVQSKSIENLARAVERIQKISGPSSNATENIEKFALALKSVGADADSIIAGVARLQNSFFSLSSVMRDAKVAAVELRAAISKKFKFDVKANVDVKALKNIGKDIQKHVKDVTVSSKVDLKSSGATSAKNLSEDLKRVSTHSREATNEMHQLGVESAKTFRRFGAFTIAVGIYRTLTAEIRQTVRAAWELEREFIRIGQTTGQTFAQTRELRDEIFRLSGAYGTASADLSQSALTLAQAGIGIEETRKSLEALAKTDLSPTFGNIKNTTEAAIAIFNQFKTSAADLEGQLGSINAVAKSFAVESEDIVSAIRKTGGVFKAAGGDLNELMALFTAVRSTTRESADSIATGLRTIFVRIQRKDTVDALERLGISLRDIDTNLFVGPFEAFKRISAVLSTMDARSETVAKITEELGGYRQVSRVTPLIHNFDIANRALNVALKGQDSLLEDVTLGQESLVVQFARLRNEFEALVFRIQNDEGFRQLAEHLINIARAAIRVADSLRPLIPIIAAVGAVAIGKPIKQYIGGFRQEFLKKNKGGFIPGGGPDMDTIPAMLTTGEYVLNRTAVKKIGVSTLDRMNNLKGFNSGGLVGYNLGGLAKGAGKIALFGGIAIALEQVVLGMNKTEEEKKKSAQETESALALLTKTAIGAATAISMFSAAASLVQTRRAMPAEAAGGGIRSLLNFRKKAPVVPTPVTPVPAKGPVYNPADDFFTSFNKGVTGKRGSGTISYDEAMSRERARVDRRVNLESQSRRYNISSRGQRELRELQGLKGFSLPYRQGEYTVKGTPWSKPTKSSIFSPLMNFGKSAYKSLTPRSLISGVGLGGVAMAAAQPLTSAAMDRFGMGEDNYFNQLITQVMGGVAGGAGTGAIFGPVVAGIGGIVGGVGALAREIPGVNTGLNFLTGGLFNLQTASERAAKATEQLSFGKILEDSEKSLDSLRQASSPESLGKALSTLSDVNRVRVMSEDDLQSDKAKQFILSSSQVMIDQFEAIARQNPAATFEQLIASISKASGIDVAKIESNLSRAYDALNRNMDLEAAAHIQAAKSVTDFRSAVRTAVEDMERLRQGMRALQETALISSRYTRGSSAVMGELTPASMGDIIARALSGTLGGQSAQEFNRFTQNFANMGGVGTTISQQAAMQARAIDATPKAIATAAKQGLGPTEFSSELRKILGSSRDADREINRFNKVLQDLGVNQDADEMALGDMTAEMIQQAISGYSSGSVELSFLKEVASAYEQHDNDIRSIFKQRESLESEYISRLQSARNIQFESRDDFTRYNTMSRSMSMGEASFRDEAERRDILVNSPGLQGLDAGQLLNVIRESRDRQVDISQVAATPESTAEFESLNAVIKDATSALEHMRDSTRKASVLREQLNRLEEKQKGKQDVLERALVGDNQERARLQRNVFQANQVVSGASLESMPQQDRAAILDLIGAIKGEEERRRVIERSYSGFAGTSEIFKPVGQTQQGQQIMGQLQGNTQQRQEVGLALARTTNEGITALNDNIVLMMRTFEDTLRSLLADRNSAISSGGRMTHEGHFTHSVTVRFEGQALTGMEEGMKQYVIAKVNQSLTEMAKLNPGMNTPSVGIS